MDKLTTLHEQLAAQPGVYLCDKIDEPSFFSNDDRYGRGIEPIAAPQPGLAAARRIARPIGAREPPLEVRQARLRGGGRKQTGNDEV